MALPERERIDIGELQDIASRADIERARQSTLLEQQIEPETAAFRTGATQRLNQLTQQGGQIPDYQQQAFQQAFQRQQAMPQDIALAQQQNLAILRDPSAAFNTPALRNAVFQQAFQRGGQAGLRGRGLQEIGGAFFAQNLLGAQQQARSDSLRFGGFEADLNQRNLQNRISIADFMDRQNEQEFNRAFQATQLGQSIQKPQVGLTGSDLASARVSDINAQNTFNAERAKLAQMQKKKKKKWGATIGTVVGGIAGSFIGMPMLGAAVGGAIGGAVDGGSEGAAEGGMSGMQTGSTESFQGFSGQAASGIKSGYTGLFGTPIEQGSGTGAAQNVPVTGGRTGGFSSGLF